MTENRLVKNSVKQYLASPAVQLRTKELLGERSSQFVTSLTSMVGADNKLAQCEPASLFMAALTAASLDLPINVNLSFAHIIPFKNNSAGVTEAQFQMGWRGYIQLAQRSGQYKTIAATAVHEGQLVSEDPLSGNTYDWTITGGNVIGYVAQFTLINGFEKELYMTVDSIKKHADRYSKAYNHGKGYGPWKDNFDAMALKTVIKLLIKNFGPMSIDMQKAVNLDQAVIKDNDDVEYVDGEEMSIEDVGADEDQKQAIIDANTPDEPEVAPAASPSPEPAEPKETVAEKAKRKYGPKQKSLIDQEPGDDNRSRNNPGNG